MDKVFRAHTAEVTALAAEHDKLVSGGKDHKLAIYSTAGGDIQLEKTIDFEGSFPKSLDYFMGKLLVGLRNGSIYEIDEASEAK